MITKQSCNTSDVLIKNSPPSKQGTEVPLMCQGTNRFFRVEQCRIQYTTEIDNTQRPATVRIVDFLSCAILYYAVKCDILILYDLKKEVTTMKLQTRLAVLVCKASGAVLRKLGRGGTNLPGKLALKIDKNILGELSRGVKVTVVTGTNGKTTTSRMIEQAFADAGLKYFSNKSGANLLTGIIAVFAQHSTLSGKCPYTHALIECDEAAFRRTSEYLPVECLVVNNIFRDQLDRYGEITHTLNAIREGITHVPDATLCLNADCSLTASLADNVPNKIVWFGVNVPIYKETAHELSDAPYCIHCKTEYEYDYITYGHLGGFRCPKCGYHRQTPQVAVTKVLATGADSSDIILDIFGHEHEVHVNLPGGYNIYNAAAEAAVAHVVGIDEQTAVSALSQFECGFGRAEQFKLGQAQARMMLVKNPAGFNQVINLIAHDEGNYKLAFLLNDRFADGTDISWIWDVDFEALADQQVRFTRVLVSGVRADDMALRLKYAGFAPERIEVIREYDRLLTEIGSDETPAFLMPTYTAMFDLRGEISKHTDVKAFYE